jgi:hypothetical protein
LDSSSFWLCFAAANDVYLYSGFERTTFVNLENQVINPENLQNHLNPG